MQHPTGTFYGSRYSLGNYDQCLKTRLVTGAPQILIQYCLVDVKLTVKGRKRYEKLDAFSTTDEYLKVSIGSNGTIVVTALNLFVKVISSIIIV